MTTASRKSSSRKVAKATPKRTAKATPRRAAKATPRRATKAAPRRAAKKAAPRGASSTARTVVAHTVAAPPPGSIDLAGGLRAYLGSIDVEVRAVSSLSERIDALVSELNDLRDQQAKRLVVLDALAASVTDGSLKTFLGQAIKPRKTRVTEVIPERLL